MNNNTKFLIVGLGLLGGSFAEGLTNAGYSVKAIDCDQKTIEFALGKGIICAGNVMDEQMIAEADIIIFGLYPTVIKEWILQHQHLFKANALLTDVSGVKGKMVEEIQSILCADAEFLGAHPMAGKEVGGVQNSDVTMFKGANFIITPTAKNTQQAIETVRKVAQILDFKNISILTCPEHDEMIAFVSQLTHAIAVSLMNAKDNTHLKEYTGDSFRDLTRIAKINETLWSELFFLNKEKLISEINLFSRELENLKDKLINNDTDGLKALFIQSTARRKHFDKN